LPGLDWTRLLSSRQIVSAGSGALEEHFFAYFFPQIIFIPPDTDEIFMKNTSYVRLAFSLLAISFILGCSSSFSSSNVTTVFASSLFSNLTELLGTPADTVGIQAMTQDSSGNTYIAGNTQQSLNGQSLTGTTDLVIVKYDSTGTIQWTKLMGVAAKSTSIFSLTTDGTNIFATGLTNGNLNGQTLTGSTDLFVIEFDNTGAALWTKMLGVAGQATYGYAITYDGTNLEITGKTTGNLDGQTLTGNIDMFLTQYSTVGVKQWTKLLGVVGEGTVGTSITSDGTDVYVGGYTNGNLDGQTLTGTQDLFLTQYDTSGNKQWTKMLGSAGNETVIGQIYSKANPSAIYVAGLVSITVPGTFDGQTLYNGAGNDLFLTKYNSTGAKLWTRTLDGSGSTQASAMTVDTSGNPIVVGIANGNVDGQAMIGTTDALVVKYDSSGNKQSASLVGTAGSQIYPNAVSIDGSGNIFMAGVAEFYGTINGQTFSGNQEGFLTKYAP